jgi:mono/diheme cytochrome c family protein
MARRPSRGPQLDEGPGRGRGGRRSAFTRSEEGWRVTPRFRLVLALGTIALAGCDGINAGKVEFVHSSRLDGPEFEKKPKLRDKVVKATNDMFGSSPNRLKVPAGSGLPAGGAHLGNYIEFGDAAKPQRKAVLYRKEDGKVEIAEGGQALYRRHCLHCHGVTGDGAGPTATFLFPRPRDYRKGLFKFTSTETGAKPTRADLKKTLLHGLAGTSMPAFEAQMTEPEIEAVLDYLIFLSMRGEVETMLVEEAANADESDPEALSDEVVQEISSGVFAKWKMAETQVVSPATPRPETTPESVARGRALFLGQTPEKLECAGCHGPQAVGNGPSYIDAETFNQYVFSLHPSREKYAELKKVAEEKQKKWGDDWGDPLRPANLNLDNYKGGRRPIDIYWRVAKGINGTPMPAHASVLKPEQLWDVVNFVLALPYDPELLKGATLPAVPAAPAAVANR